MVCACTLSAGVYHFRDYTARYRGNGACTFFVRCCFKRPIRIQIAQILGLGIGNLCEAGRPEGLPFFLQNGLKNVALFSLEFGYLEVGVYLCQREYDKVLF